MTKTKFFYTAIIVSAILVNTSACTENASSQEAKQVVEILPVNGKELYGKNCSLCHGSDGAKGMSGASNLAISQLSREGRIEIITNGKGAMAAYNEKLSEQEIIAIADYLDQLKK